MAKPLAGFGERLRSLRKQKNLSQTELGQQAGLHYTNIGRFGRGLALPGGDTLKRLADVLNVSGDYLLGGATDGAAGATFADREQSGRRIIRCDLSSATSLECRSRPPTRRQPSGGPPSPSANSPITAPGRMSWRWRSPAGSVPAPLLARSGSANGSGGTAEAIRYEAGFRGAGTGSHPRSTRRACRRGSDVAQERDHPNNRPTVAAEEETSIIPCISRGG